MLPVLSDLDGFEDLPLKTRQKAAWHARQFAMRHWQIWASVLATFALIISAAIASHYLGFEQDGAIGALIGFMAGMAIYSWALKKVGAPNYRDLLNQERHPIRITVQPGDSWAFIAQQHQISVQDLVSLNPLIDSALLLEGQSIKVGPTISDDLFNPRRSE